MAESSDDDSFISTDSEISDFDSRDESPSSGFVDDTEESNSVLSDSTIGSVTRKQKKRVTFQTGENLVLIREIPPREIKSDSDTAVESDCDSEDSEEELIKRTQVNCAPKIAKGSYEVKKLSGKTVAKIAAITGAKLPTISDNNSDSKKTVKKRSVKRKPKPNNADESESVKTDKTDVPKATKQRGSRSRNGRKTKSEAKSNTPKVKTKLKEETKNTKKKVPPQQDTISAGTTNLTCKQQVRVEKPHSSDKNDDNNTINNDSIPEAEFDQANRIIGLFDNEIERHMVKKIEKVYVIENELLSLSQNRETPVVKRLDFKSMSKTNRRLYSWLLANGNIPNPQQPCISPMWDSQGDVKSGNGVVKAPT